MPRPNTPNRSISTACSRTALVLALRATAVARDQLRALRDSNPGLFARVVERINAGRADPGGTSAGRVVRLDDGSSARLATYYDVEARQDLALVWTIAKDDATATDVMTLVRVQHVG